LQHVDLAMIMHDWMIRDMWVFRKNLIQQNYFTELDLDQYVKYHYLQGSNMNKNNYNNNVCYKENNKSDN
jgi:hypothetical protein